MNPSNNVVLLEGQDDLGVLKQFLTREGFANGAKHRLTDAAGRSLELSVIGSYSKLPSALSAALQTRPDRIAVVVDANSDPGSRWKSVTDAMVRAGLPRVADRPEDGGTILAMEGQPVVGVWMMPDNGSSGYLEDWMGRVMRAEDQLWPLAKSAVAGIPDDLRKFKSVATSKANFHTWLAWQEEPSTMASTAIKADYVDLAHPLARAYVDWLKRWLGTELV
ncbi:MAG: hypothetical protein JNL98_13215 [Bryobacterales bacterium]|nr:hypothetical protein [Bryobacterales bacterium]